MQTNNDDECTQQLKLKNTKDESEEYKRMLNNANNGPD